MVEMIVADGGQVSVVDVPEWLGAPWRAWHRLNQDRHWIPGGMGPSLPRRITLEQVRAWCVDRSMDREDVIYYDACMGAMDAVYLKWYMDSLPKPKTPRVNR